MLASGGDVVGLLVFILVVIFVPTLARYGPRQTANSVKAVKNEVAFRAEDRRRAAEGRPSQEQAAKAALDATARFIAHGGYVPTSDAAAKALGWDEATDGVAAREAAIRRLQQEVDQLKQSSPDEKS